MVPPRPGPEGRGGPPCPAEPELTGEHICGRRVKPTLSTKKLQKAAKLYLSIIHGPQIIQSKYLLVPENMLFLLVNLLKPLIGA